MAIQALIFDMDGTLLDNMDVHVQAWLALLARQNIHWDADQFNRATAGLRNPELVARVFGVPQDDAAALALADQKEAHYRELMRDQIAPLPGLRALLEAARTRGLKLAVATSAPRDNIPFTLDGLGLAQTFDSVVGADDVQRGKPAPDIFLLAAARLGVPAAACLVFEDAVHGVEAGKRAGMRVIGIATMLPAAQLLAHGADDAIDDYTQFDLTAALEGY